MPDVKEGGGESSRPFRPCLIGYGAPIEDVAENIKANILAGIPEVKKFSRSGRLAIVGGGPSIKNHLDELWLWKPDDLWAINGTGRYLRTKGIDGLAFSVDPNEHLTTVIGGARGAILASCCPPSTFGLYPNAEMFHMDTFGGKGLRAKGGPTSATRAHFPALWMGYSEIHYFGCEGSFEGDSHAYGHIPDDDALIIRANGRDFTCHADHLMQSEVLSMFIREFPGVLKDRSGGLLAAMVADPDGWECVGYSRSLKEKFEGKQECFNEADFQAAR